MLETVRRYFRRRKLAFAVGAVPALLKRRYGGLETYTAGQLRRTVEDLGLPAHPARLCLRRMLHPR